MRDFVFFFLIFFICYSVSFTFKTSCKEDIEPNGLGERGKDGGCSRGRCGAARLAPKILLKKYLSIVFIAQNSFSTEMENNVYLYRYMVVK